MPITNYDTRPKSPPLRGSDHTEKPSHHRLLSLSAAALFAAAGLAVAGWWISIVLDRWINGAAAVTATEATVAGSGILALLLWAGAFLFLRRARRN